MPRTGTSHTRISSPVSPRSSRRANWRVTPSTSGRVYSVPLTESFALVMASHSFEVFASATSFARTIVRRARQMLAIDLAGIRLSQIIEGVHCGPVAESEGGYG